MFIDNRLQNARLVGQIKALKAPKPWGEKDLGEEAEREAKLSALYKCVHYLRHMCQPNEEPLL